MLKNVNLMLEKKWKNSRTTEDSDEIRRPQMDCFQGLGTCRRIFLVADISCC